MNPRSMKSELLQTGVPEDSNNQDKPRRPANTLMGICHLEKGPTAAEPVLVSELCLLFQSRPQFLRATRQPHQARKLQGAQR